MHIESIGDGPDLVLVHGWAMHAGIFAPLRDALARQHRLHLVDLPGHGRSTARDVPLRLDDCARRIVDAVPRATWLGWSLGGLVCLEAARAHPDAVDSLVLIAASPRFVVADDWPHGVDPDVFRQFARDLARDYAGTLDRFLALECVGSDCARAELRTLRAQVFAHGEPAPRVLIDGLDVLARADFRASLASLTCPSLWIAGLRDRLIPPSAMQWAAAHAPRATFAPITGGGHAPFIGHPDRVLTAIADWQRAGIAA